MTAPPIFYKKHLPALAKYGVAVEHFPDYRNPVEAPHRLDVLLVSFVVKGEGRHVMEDSVVPESGGCVGITLPGEVHSIVTEGEGMEIFNIYLDPGEHPLPSLPPPLRNTQQVLFPDGDALVHRLNRSLHFQAEDPGLLHACVRGLHREMQTSGADGQELAASLLRVFLICCCRSARQSGVEPSQPSSDPVPEWVLRLCRILDEHYSEPLTLEDLAARFGMSRGYLCRMFKRHVGVTVFTYLTRRRIQAAMSALRGGGDKVLSVAMDSGFRDLSHFNRVFKAQTGKTPLAYRKNTRSGEEP